MLPLRAVRHHLEAVAKAPTSRAAWLLSSLYSARRLSTQPQANNDATSRECRRAEDDAVARQMLAGVVPRQLQRVHELQERVAGENSKVGKQEIIGEYPDLRELLQFVYDPNLRTHLTFGALMRHLPKYKGRSTVASYSIIDLFTTLSSRQITGYEAKDTVLDFLRVNGILGDSRYHHLMQTFGRLLDRNLIAGFGARTLREVRWKDDTATATEHLVPNISPTVQISNPHNSTTISDTSPPSLVSPHSLAAPPSTSPAPPTITSTPTPASTPSSEAPNDKTPLFPNFGSLRHFQVALGKSIEPPFTPLFGKTGAETWYASRKLDGVRALTFVDFLVPTEPSSALKVASVHFVSRSGKEFSALQKLEEQLVHLGKMEQIREWLKNDPEIIERRKEGAVKRLVLDGEVCVMRPKLAHEVRASSPRDDGSAASAAAAIWTANDPHVEDFPSTVSAMRRKDAIPHLSYFLFDVLSWAEVRAAEALRQAGLSKTFSQRVEDVKALSGWLSDELDKKGVEEKIVKGLVQWKIEGVDEIEGMVKRAADEGWEGLIFRAEKPYKGKRSPDIRKFKKWQDAEYRVVSLDTSKMRLATNGVFAEHTALANVWIEHDGHPVSVGSGFTADQRIRYAQKPETIVGKMITVEYFSESEAVGREGKKSLRFPRIKAVWEEGERDM